jgi:peroxiredoxin
MPIVWLGLVGCVPHLYSDGADGPSGYHDSDTGCAWAAPSNSWEVQTPPACLQGEGYEVGQVVPDLRLQDQFGAEVSLWQFAGDLILFDVSTLWCGPCQLLGADAESTYQKYKDQGFVYVTVIQQDNYGAPAKPQDVQAWADGFAITAPVLGDPDAKTTPALEVIGGIASFPGVLLVGRDLKVIERVATDTESVDEAVRTHL